MKVIKETTDGLFEMSVPGAPRFKRFEAAFGWMEPNMKEDRKSVHAFMVGGEQEDGTRIIFEEYIGNFPDVFAAAVDAKDRLQLKRICLDRSRREFLLMLSHDDDCEGLTRYLTAGNDVMHRKVYIEKEPLQRWPNFRSFATTAALFGVPDILPASLSDGFNRIVTLGRNNELQIHEDCTELCWCLDHKIPGEITDHPVVIAAIYVVWALEYYRERVRPSVPQQAARWPNLSRKG